MLSKSRLTAQYLDLLKKSLVNLIYIENEYIILSALAKIFARSRVKLQDLSVIDRQAELFQQLLHAKSTGKWVGFTRENWNGSRTSAPDLRNYTELSHTMIGTARLDNIQQCMETILTEGIPGDMIETGVWRGGATIFMKGVLTAYGVTDRTVWVADSFQGVPPPTHPQDVGFDISSRVYPFLSVSQDAVIELFKRYDLIDERVKFLPGWFADTLPRAPIAALALLRLDGDLYSSTMDALNPLYPKVSKGGFVIVDDYNSCAPCNRAIHDFREVHKISDEMIRIDEQSIFWRKS
jgi:hypothetical protein